MGLCLYCFFGLLLCLGRSLLAQEIQFCLVFVYLLNLFSDFFKRFLLAELLFHSLYILLSELIELEYLLLHFDHLVSILHEANDELLSDLRFEKIHHMLVYLFLALL